METTRRVIEIRWEKSAGYTEEEIVNELVNMIDTKVLVTGDDALDAIASVEICGPNPKDPLERIATLEDLLADYKARLDKYEAEKEE